MSWISGIFEVHRLPVKALSWIFVFTGFLSLSPNSWAAKLGMASLVNSFRGYISAVFLASASILLVNLVIRVIGFAQAKLDHAKWRSGLSKAISELDYSEKAILREFYIQARNSIQLPFNDPSVTGLRRKGIVKPIGNVGEYSYAGMLLPFAMTSETKEILGPEMIGLPPGEPTDEEIEWIRSSRPDFIKAIQRRSNLLDW
jgi:hypothetical protein